MTEPISSTKKSVKAVPKFTIDTKDLKPQYLDHFSNKKKLPSETQDDNMRQSQMSAEGSARKTSKLRSHSHHPLTYSSSVKDSS